MPNPTQPTSPAAPRELNYDDIELYEDLLGPASPPGEPSRMQFTEEGRAYYGWWFRRHGFELSDDPDTFFRTFRAINRAGLEDEMAAGGALFDARDKSFMSPAQREIADALNQTLATGKPAPGSDVVAVVGARTLN